MENPGRSRGAIGGRDPVPWTLPPLRRSAESSASRVLPREVFGAAGRQRAPDARRDLPGRRLGGPGGVGTGARNGEQLAHGDGSKTHSRRDGQDGLGRGDRLRAVEVPEAARVVQDQDRSGPERGHARGRGSRRPPAARHRAGRCPPARAAIPWRAPAPTGRDAAARRAGDKGEGRIPESGVAAAMPRAISWRTTVHGAQTGGRCHSPCTPSSCPAATARRAIAPCRRRLRASGKNVARAPAAASTSSSRGVHVGLGPSSNVIAKRSTTPSTRERNAGSLIRRPVARWRRRAPARGPAPPAPVCEASIAARTRGEISRASRSVSRSRSSPGAERGGRRSRMLQPPQSVHSRRAPSSASASSVAYWWRWWMPGARPVVEAIQRVRRHEPQPARAE